MISPKTFVRLLKIHAKIDPEAERRFEEEYPWDHYPITGLSSIKSKGKITIADVVGEQVIWSDIINAWMQKERTCRETRDIPENVWETYLQHSINVIGATKIFWKNYSAIEREKLFKMAKYFNIPRYKEQEYLPGEISDEEAYKRENAVFSDLQRYYSQIPNLIPKRQEMLKIWEEYKKWDTQDAKIIKDLSLWVTSVQAMEYEKMWYKQMTDFYPYTLENLHDDTLKNILQILLKKQYPTINTYEQYFLLLANNGDEAKFTEKMEKKLDRQNRKLASPI